MKVWTLDGSELISVCGDDGSLVLGVLEESVVSLSGFGLLRMSQPVNQTPTVHTQLGISGRRLNAVNSVMLPKHRRLLLVSEDGILYQVRLLAVQLQHRQVRQEVTYTSFVKQMIL